MTKAAISPEYIIVAILLFPFVLGIYRRREAILLGIRRLILVEGAFFLTVYIASHNGWNSAQSIVAGLFAAFLVNWWIPAGRSRHIRKSEHRKIVDRFEAKTGKKYDPKIHHRHHKVPFSDGGNNTADNLEIIDSKENLSRGDKAPWWDVIGKRR